MPQVKYTVEYKAKVILTILQSNKSFNSICEEFGLNPNMVRKWKNEFLKNAHFAFSADNERKEVKRKEESLKRENDKMDKTIGQLMLERDFLQDCFRQVGAPIPKMPNFDFKK